MFLTWEFKNYKSTLFINYFKPNLKFFCHMRSQKVSTCSETRTKELISSLFTMLGHASLFFSLLCLGGW